MNSWTNTIGVGISRRFNPEELEELREYFQPKPSRNFDQERIRAARKREAEENRKYHEKKGKIREEALKENQDAVDKVLGIAKILEEGGQPDKEELSALVQKTLLLLREQEKVLKSTL